MKVGLMALASDVKMADDLVSERVAMMDIVKGSLLEITKDKKMALLMDLETVAATDIEQ